MIQEIKKQTLFEKFIRYIHNKIERACIKKAVHFIHRSQRDGKVFKTPWWFKLASKVEFKLRYMYRVNPNVR